MYTMHGGQRVNIIRERANWTAKVRHEYPFWSLAVNATRLTPLLALAHVPSMYWPTVYRWSITRTCAMILSETRSLSFMSFSHDIKDSLRGGVVEGTRKERRRGKRLWLGLFANKWLAPHFWMTFLGGAGGCCCFPRWLMYGLLERVLVRISD